MKTPLTADQKAANSAAKKKRQDERAGRIAKGGESGIVATLENITENFEDRLAETDESMDSVREEIKSMMADVEKVKSAFRTRSAGKQTEGMDVQKFKIGNLAIARKEGRFEDAALCGYELECLEQASKGWNRNASKKDIISSLSGGAGGNALPVQVASTIIEAARSKSNLFEMGITNDTLEGLSGYSIPYEVTSTLGVGTGVINTPGTTQEGASLPSTRPGFRLASFTPRRMGMFIGMTEDYLKQGGNFVSNFVERTAAKDMRNQLERFCLSGRGQQFSEPTGILKRTDLTASTVDPTRGGASANGSALTFADLNDMEIDLAEANRLTDNCKYYTRPAVIRGLRKQTATYALAGANATNSMPITPLQFMSMEKLAEYVGYEIKWSTNMPKDAVIGSTTNASYLVYGDWENMHVPFWGPMEFEMSNIATVGSVSAFENYLFYMRFVQMFDVNLVAPDSFTSVSGFLTQGF